MPYQLDQTDRRILSVLLENARISNSELAERVNLSPSPCWQRVRKLEERGYIKKYTAVLDQALLGMPDTALVEIRLQQHDSTSFEEFGAKLSKLPEVLEIFAKTGEFEFFLKVAVNGTAGLDEFIQRKLHPLPEIRETRSNFVLRNLKETRAYLPEM
ncbi:Lrp/AsnC family transcriptional regulator [Ruegeria sp. HKCCD8929]|uniref:Lrp/AsnC family transcriptional regulator n=1 Tax=Ruegeria sp. HKCCD8929 TaxID=2683006 RepID=UPI001489231F|nr:Lrp/AsnC family transcriptional regulator [Ruegeria sp. HKCCD8929]